MTTSGIDADLVRRAEKYFADGKFRDARELYKILCKSDRERFLPRLIDCYYGQITHFIGNKQFSEALVVLDRIKTLAGENDRYRKAKALIEDAAANRSSSPPSSLLPFPVPKTPRPAAPEADTRRAAIDRGIVLFESPEELAAGGLVPAVEIRSIRSAFELLCESKFNEASEALRSIPFASPLKEWKLLLKGLISFYGRDDRKALDAFVNLQEKGLPWKVALPFRVCIETDPRFLHEWPQKQKLIADACLIAGKKEAASYLPRAYYLWQAGRYRDSLEFLRASVRRFPDPQGFIGCLSVLYYSEQPLPANYKNGYVAHIRNYADPNKSRNPFESFLIIKQMLLESMAVLQEGEEPPVPLLLALVDELILSYRAFFPGADEAKAMVLEKLGNSAAKPAVENAGDSFFGSRSRKPDHSRWERARLFFEKSIATGHASPEAYKGALSTYIQSGKKKEAERFALNMAERFADNREILFTVGLYLYNSGKFKSSIDPLEKASALDPLDSNARKVLLTALFAAARQAAESRRAGSMREYMQKAMEHALRESADYVMGARFILIRWAAFEFLARHPREGAAKLGEEAVGNGEVEAVYFAYCIFVVFSVRDSIIDDLSNRVNAFVANNRSVSSLMTTLSVFDFLHAIVTTNKKAAGKSYLLEEEKRRLSDYFLNVVASGDALSRQEAERCIRFFMEMKKTNKARSRLLRRFLSIDAKDPVFAFLKFLGDHPGFAERPFGVRHSHIVLLKGIFNEARLRGETALANEVEALLEKADFGAFDAPIPSVLRDVLEELERFDDDEDGEEPDFPRIPRFRRQAKRGNRKKRSVPGRSAGTGSSRPREQRDYPPDGEQLELPF